MLHTFTFASGFINRLLCTGITAVSVYFVYTYRYDCLYHMCVCYAWFKRKYSSKPKENVIKSDVFRTLDFTTHRSNPPHNSNNIVSIPLFPYIETIRFSEDVTHRTINNDTLCLALKDYTIKYDTNEIYSEQRICLYNHIAKEFADLPHTITVVLDKPLLNLLKIKQPVRLPAGDAVYQLSADSIECIDLPQ